MSDKSKILVVDDEQVVCDILHDELSERGYLCATVLSGDDALAKLSNGDFQVVLLDIRLPGMSGMEVLQEIWLEHDNTATIMITAVDDVDTAVEAMKLGASDYLVKPFDLDRVDASIRIALETKPAIIKSSNEIDTIAFGVEARLDSLFGYSRIATQETIDIARKLGIADGEIQEWAAARATLYSDRDRVIKSSLNKLERSPLTQSIMGITEIHLHSLKSNESQN
ncbi:MAG TPA: response regulator [Dehalococcoidia bacterium]|jgi:DNA-binding NtrC family response regulator|nr:response regulator [Dehalococcoidia bacterium]